MINQAATSAAQQVNAVRDQLLQAYTRKHDLEAQLKQADEQIAALRNLITGIPVGQRLAQEIAAEQAPPPARPAVPSDIA